MSIQNTDIERRGGEILHERGYGSMHVLAIVRVHKVSIRVDPSPFRVPGNTHAAHAIV